MNESTQDNPNYQVYIDMLQKGLLDEYKGQFLAFVNGKIVDTDTDKGNLIGRVRSEYEVEHPFIQYVRTDIKRKEIKPPTGRRLESRIS